MVSPNRAAKALLPLSWNSASTNFAWGNFVGKPTKCLSYRNVRTARKNSKIVRATFPLICWSFRVLLLYKDLSTAKDSRAWSHCLLYWLHRCHMINHNKSLIMFLPAPHSCTHGLFPPLEWSLSPWEHRPTGLTNHQRSDLPHIHWIQSKIPATQRHTSVSC